MRNVRTERWWWLGGFLLLSVLLHIFLALHGPSFGLKGEAPSSREIELTLEPLPPAKKPPVPKPKVAVRPKPTPKAVKEMPKIAAKPMRAPLLIAVVLSLQPSLKVADWEQEAGASGVAHTLSLLLDDAGWGVMWRSGHHTRSLPVRVMHGLADNEQLLGWLYVGGRPHREKPGQRNALPAEQYLSVL